MEHHLRKLAVGEHTFEDIRRQDMIYVDKTGYFPSLRSMGKTVFLSRPRKFGKSLTLSALDAYYSGKTELFEGLAVHGHMVSGSFAPKPVIRLNMNEIAGSMTVEELESGLTRILDGNAERHGVVLDGDWPSCRIWSLLEKIFDQQERRSVVLIDEYDVPATPVAQERK
jgi:hypothetical protein